jgi:hypothetical protein
MRVCYGHHVTATEPLPSSRLCLQFRSLVTAVSAGFTVLAFSRRATVYCVTLKSRPIPLIVSMNTKSRWLFACNYGQLYKDYMNIWFFVHTFISQGMKVCSWIHHAVNVCLCLRLLQLLKHLDEFNDFYACRTVTGYSKPRTFLFTSSSNNMENVRTYDE